MTKNQCCSNSEINISRDYVDEAIRNNPDKKVITLNISTFCMNCSRPLQATFEMTNKEKEKNG